MRRADGESCGREWAVVYVDVDAAGAADGSSWDDAFPSVFAALAAADPGYKLWIAEGTYARGGARPRQARASDP